MVIGFLWQLSRALLGVYFGSATIGGHHNHIWCIIHFFKCTVYSLVEHYRNKFLLNLLVKEGISEHSSQKACNSESEILHVWEKVSSKNLKSGVLVPLDMFEVSSSILH